MGVLGVAHPPLLSRVRFAKLFHLHSSSQLPIMARPKTLMDFFQPPEPKRLKSSPTAAASADPISSSSSSITAEERARMEFNKSLASSRRNVKICLDIASKSKEARDNLTLEQLLVEESWLQVLPGEFEKPYAKSLCKFVEKEIWSGSTPVYPPTHLIFNALNTIPFHKVKAVILGKDPYHGDGQAMDLAFSVPEGVRVPSSLVYI